MHRDNQDLPKSATALMLMRRLYLAHLIAAGFDTVPALMEKTGMPRRTIQGAILGLRELYIDCVFEGARKNGSYRINDWGAINKEWVQKNIQHICRVLQSVE